MGINPGKNIHQLIRKQLISTCLVKVGLLFILTAACGETEDNGEETGLTNKTSTVNDTESSGTLNFGSVPLAAIISEANTQLDKSDAELDLAGEWVSSLPSGSLVIDVPNLLATGFLSRFEFMIQKLSISKEGKTWHDIYAGSPRGFDLIAGSSAETNISKQSIPTGTYNYIYIEFPEIHWQRGAACEQQTMDTQIAAILTTNSEASKYYEGSTPAEVRNEGNPGNLQDPVLAPKDFLNNRIPLPDGLEFDDHYFYLHQAVKVESGKTTGLVLSMIPEAGLSEEEDCAKAPGKPSFLMGGVADIAEAVAFTGSRKSK